MIQRYIKEFLRRRISASVYEDLDRSFLDIYARCQPYSMTSIERMYALYQGVRHVIRRGIPGDFVECGVWRGGSSMCVALTLLELGVRDRTLYLYDTYAGMSEPTEQDVNLRGKPAHQTWARSQRNGSNEWCYESLPQVRENLLGTGYPEDKLQFVQGLVEQTIPAVKPDAISLLRLDTDWYESTRHELIHLYPLLQPGGVLVLDDYGHWQGARQAVDEYFAENALPLLLSRIDYTGRIAVKV